MYTHSHSKVKTAPATGSRVVNHRLVGAVIRAISTCTQPAQLSYDDLAARAGYKRRSVINAVRQMEADGCLAVERCRDSGGHQAANRFTILSAAASQSRGVL